MPEKEPIYKPQLELEINKSPHASKLSPEPPNLTPVTNAAFGNNRSPLLTLINEERKSHEPKKTENGQVDEDDPISAAIQRVIAQSSMDDDSDDMDLFAVSASSNVVTEEIQNLPKNSQITCEPKPELLVNKKVSSKRKSVGKRILLSKEFVMDDSSSETDSDSAEERLVIVNEDDSTNDSNRSQKNVAVATDEEEKLVIPLAEAKFNRAEDEKSPPLPAETSTCKVRYQRALCLFTNKRSDDQMMSE